MTNAEKLASLLLSVNLLTEWMMGEPVTTESFAVLTECLDECGLDSRELIEGHDLIYIIKHICSLIVELEVEEDLGALASETTQVSE